MAETGGQRSDAERRSLSLTIPLLKSLILQDLPGMSKLLSGVGFWHKWVGDFYYVWCKE